VSDDLRTRIASAVLPVNRCWNCGPDDQPCNRCQSTALQTADAVIAELATTYVSRAAMMTEIQSYATDHENLGLAESAQDLIDTAAEWDQWK
jgi:hypothetical protein